MNTPLLFPRRQLGLQTLLTPKSEQLSISQLALIAIANLLAGDQLSLPKGTLKITDNTQEHIRYTFTTWSGAVFQECVLPEQLTNSALFAAFCHLIPTLAPAYTDPLCQVLERDPAVYRLRTQQGWVINDALSKMSGNVQYPKGPGVGVRCVPPEEDFIPVALEPTIDGASNDMTSEITTPSLTQTQASPPPETGKEFLQGSFDF